MMKTSTFFSKALFSLLFILLSVFSFGQNVGDFRTSGSGDWKTPGIWEVWNGSAWVSSVTYYPSAGRYPGQVDGNYTVTIVSGTTVTINDASTFTTGHIYVKGTLILKANVTILPINGLAYNLYIEKGVIKFDRSVKLTLPLGSNLLMDINNEINQGLHPLDGNSDCNNNTEIVIGNSKYTACTGSGNTDVGTFADLNKTAIEVKANPAASPIQICLGENTFLSGSYLLTGTTITPNVSYKWELSSQPLSSSINFGSGSKDVFSPNLIVAGDYTFMLIVNVTVNSQVRSNFQNIKISVGKTTTYVSGNWNNGHPSSTARMNAVIAEDYNTRDKGSFFGCNCTVNSGNSLTIGDNTNVTVKDNITNYGSIVVESDGNLVQINDSGFNTGSITVKRNANVPAMQYAYWASPVQNQSMYTIYQVPANRVMTYNTWNNYFTIIASPATAIKAKGYSLRGPDSNTSTFGVTATFTGVPNNGLITIPVTTGGGVNNNLVGNPYPSNIDIDKLYQSNSSLISSTFLFWDNTGNTVVNQQGSNYTGSNYVTYNAATGTGVTGIPGGNKPNGIAKVGQGFIVKAISPGGNLIFNNSHRTKDHIKGSSDSYFFKMANTATERDRYWLNLLSPDSSESSIAVVYDGNAKNHYEEYDSEIPFGVHSSIFMLAENHIEPLIIQGRNSSNIELDVVALVMKHDVAGKYIVSGKDFEGVFGKEQAVYLYDRLLHTYTNLTKKSYEYVASVGIVSDRFEIVYKNKSIISAEVPNTKTAITIHKSDEQFIIQANGQKLKNIQIFDMSGRLVYEINTSGSRHVVEASKMSAGVYLFNIETDKEKSTKRIRK